MLPHRTFTSARAAFSVFAAACIALSGGCKPKPTTSPEPSASPTTAAAQQQASTPAPQSTPKPGLLTRLREPKVEPPKPQSPPPPREIWKEFSGLNAFAEVQSQVNIGPRPSGSPELEKARQLIVKALTQNGWKTELQEFTDQTPRGAVKFANIIARFPAPNTGTVSTATQRAIVCSHFDTKRFSTIKFVGASDGASSTGALVELSRVLAMDPELAAKVELVFFDGEEAVSQFTETDGLYGSRFYAKTLRDSGRFRQFEFGILWDMIGDKDLTITLSPDSPQPLTQQVLAAAESLGLRRYFSYFDRSITDDHGPLNRAHIPTVDLIDFDYMPWHTADDTLDKLSPESLQKIGAVTLKYLRTALDKPPQPRKPVDASGSGTGGENGQ